MKEKPISSDLLMQAIALHRGGDLNGAENIYKTLLSVNPEHVDALTLLGTIHSQHGQYEEGICLMDRAIAVKPDHAEAYFNRALSLQMLGHYEDALNDYGHATVIDPGYAEAFWHKSLVLLTLGRYEEGWKLYEWRWKMWQTHPRYSRLPLWQGETGKTILIHAEQGFGDTLQFCRYLQIITKENTVIFECPESLVSLLQFNFPGIKVINASDSETVSLHYHIPLLSIPGILGTTLDTIPPAPYLKAEPVYVEKWIPLVNREMHESFRVGLCWAGGQRPGMPESIKMDSRRSLHFEQLKPLLDVNGISFVSLQLGPPQHQLNDGRVKDFSPELKTWSDTAALVSCLDLVISADTAVCHLAAAIGKPTFLLNRYDTCWRWLLNRDDSPWYPSLTQFRQETPGDWKGVIEKVKAELAACFS